MSSWLRDKGASIGAIAGTIAAFIAVLQLFVVGPMNQRFNDLRAYMDQRFDAQDQRIDDLTAHMNQRFDAQDRRLDAQDERLDRLEVETTRRFDALQADNNRRFDAVNVRFDTVLEAIGSFDRRVSHLEGRLDELSTGDAN